MSHIRGKNHNIDFKQLALDIRTFQHSKSLYSHNTGFILLEDMLITLCYVRARVKSSV